MSESTNFSLLPTLPNAHRKLNGAKQKVEKCNSANETVEEKANLSKVIIPKECNTIDEKKNKVDFEDLEIHMNNSSKQISLNDLKNEKVMVVQNEMPYQYIDELYKETEKLKLKNIPLVNSVQDGKILGNVSTYGAARTPLMYNDISPHAENYMMNHEKRGHCLIFNNSQFDLKTQLSLRNGTNEDRDSLEILFKELGFDVHIFNNLKYSALFLEINKYAYETDHSNCDALVIFFMSHGEEDVLYATDYSFPLDKLFNNFTGDNCTTMAGKPKMFFIQACRGTGVDKGVLLYHDRRDQTDYSSRSMYKIPIHSDFLVCYSTIGEHFSWRNTINGSWFIQSLVKVFREKANYEDVSSMMISVNRRMIIDFQSNCPSTPGMHGMKQTASFQSTLMRKIYMKFPQ